jgi:hypothetical protein
VLTVLLAALLLLPSFARSQEQGKEPDRRKALLEGTHVFRRILYDHGLTALNGFDDEMLASAPRRCLLVVLGDLDQLQSVPGGLEGFLLNGGAVLAASDRAIRSETVREQLGRVAGVTISADTLVCPNGFVQEEGGLFRSVCYKGLPYCPWLVPARPAGDFLFQNLPLQVATNVPSMLRLRRRVPGIRLLATLPNQCKLETRGGLEDLFGPPPFAVGGDVGEGRLLVLADHSIFINEMMLPTDNSNVEFTYNCVRWLRGEEGRRTRVLFVEDGRIQTKLDIPMKSARLPMEEALKMIFERRNELLAEGEAGLARLEENDFFNRKLLDFLDHLGWPPFRLLRPALLLGTLALLVYGVYRLGIRQRFRHDPSTPLLASAVGRNLPVAPLLEQRTDALLRGGNLWEPAAVLARRWFARLGAEGGGDEGPTFEARGGWWQRRRLLGRLRRLWRLAQGRQPERVSAPEMWRLQREMDELRAAWECGAWSVAEAKDEG